MDAHTTTEAHGWDGEGAEVEEQIDGLHLPMSPYVSRSYISPGCLLRNAQHLARKNTIRVADLVPVGLEDTGPLGTIAVELVGGTGQ